MKIFNHIFTKREMGTSIIGFCILLIIGLFISNNINYYNENIISRYNKAIIINSIEDFNFVLQNNVQDVFTIFNIETLVPVTFEELNENFLYIKRIEEHYTQKTRIITDSKGNPQIQIYNEGDIYSINEKSNKTILFNNNEIELNTFTNLPFLQLKLNNNVNEKYKKDISHEKYIYLTSKKQIYFEVINLQFSGSTFLSFNNNKITPPKEFSKITLYTNLDINSIKKDLTQNIKNKNIYFWIFWIILSILIIYIHILFENKWLNKN